MLRQVRGTQKRIDCARADHFFVPKCRPAEKAAIAGRKIISQNDQPHSTDEKSNSEKANFIPWSFRVDYGSVKRHQYTPTTLPIDPRQHNGSDQRVPAVDLPFVNRCRPLRVHRLVLPSFALPDAMYQGIVFHLSPVQSNKPDFVLAIGWCGARDKNTAG